MISGIVLAGGKNSRMLGEDKAFLKINGQLIISRILDIFKDIFGEIWIITNSPERYGPLKGGKVFVARDLISEGGPLAGIYTGLKYMNNEAGFFVACDMPNLHIGLIKRQLTLFLKGRYECLAPVHKGLVEPLHAVYTKPLAPRIYSFLKEKGGSVKGFLKDCQCRFIEVGEEEIVSFSNLNSIDDIKGSKEIAGKIESLD